MTNIFSDIRLPHLSDSLDGLLTRIAQKHGVPPFQVKHKSQKGYIVKARREFCREACKKYDQTEVAKFLGKHPSTVNHLVNNDN